MENAQRTNRKTLKRSIIMATSAGACVIGVTWCVRARHTDPPLAIWSGVLALLGIAAVIVAKATTWR